MSFSGGAALLLLRAAATGPARRRLSLHSLAAAAISLPGSLLTPSPAPARPGAQPLRAEGGLVAGGKPALVAYPSGKLLDPARGERPPPRWAGFGLAGLVAEKGVKCLTGMCPPGASEKGDVPCFGVSPRWEAVGCSGGDEQCPLLRREGTE